MLKLEEARDIVNNVVTELRDCRMVMVTIPGENSFLEIVDAKSIIKRIIKKMNIPVLVINTIIPTRGKSERKFMHALIFVRVKKF